MTQKRIRLIGGIRELEISDPLCGLWLEPVVFAMAVTDYDVGPGDPEGLILHDEEELEARAETAFPNGYEIWDMEVPPESGAPGRITHPRPLLGLISAKKVEYETARPSTPQGGGRA